MLRDHASPTFHIPSNTNEHTNTATSARAHTHTHTHTHTLVAAVVMARALVQAIVKTTSQSNGSGQTLTAISKTTKKC